MVNKFKEPIYITRPLLPDLGIIQENLKEVWESKWLTNNGPRHKKLEKDLKTYLGLEHLILFNNGTLALILGIKSLNLTGEVITTPFTFPATVEALDWNNLTPIFCDLDPKTLNLDASKIENLITEKTSAILAVHVFGNPCDVHRIQKIADKYKLKVIYDAAHAFGTKIDGIPIGKFGDLTMFSFHATKLFHTVEGGALAVNNLEMESKLNLLKNFGIRGPETVLMSGLNAKMNEVQAVIGIEVLKIIDQERSNREQILSIYRENLSKIPGIKIVNNHSGENSLQYLVITIDENIYGKSRDWVHERLKRYNVFTRKYFNPLCSNFPWYKSLDSSKPENLPIANKIIDQVLSLPFYGELSLESVEIICGLLKVFYSEND
ncbi:DegT/DnrJ/EryC1/StrS family aminotransferase [Promethearchaeum syntrophicum]|uniref:DegT/DnrJ/EryC1/StrS family aminotransferase n=1 Tax=Promethearchaeum syntrophicum TaxID=2594042 RepID=A0A5B9DAR4_9ARCH|nr:DegT/DnrJ/EryC1/StrS family aminotransferase [Candidatus Prometheoarchaeum syntrophicum]QEE16065.1 UDP-4-amino-4-deoxy-L-arabinose--oxoglutarate aminotransferase [Candidatus Prometheoarchaeum syntrophicum]